MSVLGCFRCNKIEMVIEHNNFIMVVGGCLVREHQHLQVSSLLKSDASNTSYLRCCCTNEVAWLFNVMFTEEGRCFTRITKKIFQVTVMGEGNLVQVTLDYVEVGV